MKIRWQRDPVLAQIVEADLRKNDRLCRMDCHHRSDGEQKNSGYQGTHVSGRSRLVKHSIKWKSAALHGISRGIAGRRSAMLSVA